MICPNFTVPVGFSTVVASVCFTSGCLAVVENTICLFVVHRLHSLRKTARFFMASLAASELFSGVAANFHISLLLMLHSASLGSVILWKFESALWYFTTSVVTFNLVNVSLDRYIAITSPLHYHIKMIKAVRGVNTFFLDFRYSSGIVCVHSSFNRLTQAMDLWDGYCCSTNTLLYYIVLLL